eukprot:TRINITY_DN101751_c0_g1_i1.p1 TRINITY_DN101751_c0_g1~~TRINITY_DN101751_c0_g1_i1.p1  ORF type:complete len:611 (-),score=123.19 TRINITY_DN101751_c0_g1_i1:251-2083(-)
MPQGASSPPWRLVKGAVATLLAASTARGATALEASNAPKADLVAQELQQLEGVVGLCKERLGLLKEMKSIVNSGYNLTLPDTHMRALREKVPLISDLETDPDKTTVAASDDFFVPKAIIPIDAEVAHVKWLPLRSSTTSSSSSSSHASSTQSSMPNALLVAAQLDGTVRLFTPSGDLVQSFSTGHDLPVAHLAVSPSHDEYLVVTADTAGTVKVHKVNARSRRPLKTRRGPAGPGRPEHRATQNTNPEDEKASQYLGLQANVTVQFTKQMKHPGVDDPAAPRITALTMASQQGAKYFVTGDEAGSVRIFTKNGTLHGVVETVAEDGEGVPIDSLYAHLNNLLYRAGDRWGYIDIERMIPRPMECPNFPGKVKSVVFDSQQASRILIADEEGSVWVMGVKNKQDCKIEHRFSKGSTNGDVQLASVRGFLLGIEQTGASAVFALNMSHIGKSKHDIGPLSTPVVWRRYRGASKSFAVHKRYQAGDLLAFLSEDGREIEIAELIMSVYTPPAQDSFGNFKLPVMAVAIVLVLGYQYMKGKGGEGAFAGLAKGKGGLGGGGLAGKLGGLGKGGRGGGLGGLGGGGLGGLGGGGLGGLGGGAGGLGGLGRGGKRF